MAQGERKPFRQDANDFFREKSEAQDEELLKKSRAELADISAIMGFDMSEVDEHRVKRKRGESFIRGGKQKHTSGHNSAIRSKIQYDG